MNKSKIYRVKFHEPVMTPDNELETEFFFGSLSAIYTVFTVEQIGCACKNLWANKVSAGFSYSNKKCSVSLFEVIHKPKKNG